MSGGPDVAGAHSLPASFEFGVATSAYQVEGGWDADGKGPSIWDTFTQTPGRTAGDAAGDRGCDSYARFDDDLAMLRELGVDTYRLSLSWSRLLPTGTGALNPAGIAYYDRVIDALLESGITPNVTLYHWDLPQALEDRGGWPSREVVDWFGEYACLAFARFGDRVQRWATLNEPIAQWMGYGVGRFAPGIADPRVGRLAMHHSLLAHGRAVQEFRASGRSGEIGIVLDIWQREPATDAAPDVAAALEGEDNGFRFFLDGLLGGGYSDRIVERLTAEGTMPEVREADQELIESPIDYVGVNVYSRVVVSAESDLAGGWAQSVEHVGGNFLDNGLEFYPKAVYDAVHMLLVDYRWAGPVFITENGLADGPAAANAPLVDDERIEYIAGFLDWTAAAISEGFDIRGYYCWSLMDNYEWATGYRQKFGLFRLDPETFARVPKKSAHWYRDVIADHRSRRDSGAGDSPECSPNATGASSPL